MLMGKINLKPLIHLGALIIGSIGVMPISKIMLIPTDDLVLKNRQLVVQL